MNWILSFLLLISLTVRSQNVIFGDWYHISTGRLVQMNITGAAISWNDKTFQFKDREGKKGVNSIVTVVHKDDITGIVHQTKDTSDIMPFSLTVLQQSKDLRFLDLLMECSDGSYKDTADVHNYFLNCDPPDKMIMRYYSRVTIDSFSTLKPVTGITKNDLDKINGSFKKKIDLLISKFGEDKLLWIAPVLFQQVLTDLLLENGYNPMITEKQAEKLFDFNFF